MKKEMYELQSEIQRKKDLIKHTTDLKDKFFIKSVGLHQKFPNDKDFGTAIRKELLEYVALLVDTYKSHSEDEEFFNETKNV